MRSSSLLRNARSLSTRTSSAVKNSGSRGAIAWTAVSPPKGGTDDEYYVEEEYDIGDDELNLPLRARGSFLSSIKLPVLLDDALKEHTLPALRIQRKKLKESRRDPLAGNQQPPVTVSEFSSSNSSSCNNCTISARHRA